MSTAPVHEVLRDGPGARVALLGNHAIVRGGLEAGVRFFTCYPGTPSSEIGDTFAAIAAASGILFEYSVNEKIALELAFAASLTGARSMCSMKHLGLNYAGDPLSTMPYVGVEAGLVIVSAGDPSAITSPNEQDQRHFSHFLYYPILDPATADDALRMTRQAFELSEESRLPVILRPTTRVCHTSAVVQLGPLPQTKREISFVKDPARYTPIPANVRRMRRELTQRFRAAEAWLAGSDFFPRIGTGRRGIVAGGVGYAYARQVVQELALEDQVTLLQIGAYPIPEDLLTDFLAAVDEVLVVEELTPFIEERLMVVAFRRRRQIPIFGKHSAHFPVEFEYTPDLVESAIRAYLKLAARPAQSTVAHQLPARPPVLCPGCPHRASFYYVHKVFGKQTVYSNDIGCYTLGYGEPLNTCDLLLCMGASISQASAIARTTGQRTVAFLGDSTFFHSGLPGLANAVQAGDNITIVILNNHVTAMTGFQPSFAAADNGLPAATTGLSVARAVRGLGVDDVQCVDPFDEEVTLAALRAAQAGSGVNVVICDSPCVVNQKRAAGYQRRKPYRIDQERCIQCTLCVRALGCPAIHITDGRYVIAADLCDGCELCVRVCKPGAITR